MLSHPILPLALPSLVHTNGTTVKEWDFLPSLYWFCLLDSFITHVLFGKEWSLHLEQLLLNLIRSKRYFGTDSPLLVGVSSPTTEMQKQLGTEGRKQQQVARGRLSPADISRETWAYVATSAPHKVMLTAKTEAGLFRAWDFCFYFFLEDLSFPISVLLNTGELEHWLERIRLHAISAF